MEDHAVIIVLSDSDLDSDGDTPDPHAPLSDGVYRKLRRELLAFKIRDRRDLLLTSLATRFEVSRPTVTRALNRLVKEGLLRRAYRLGYGVVETPPAEIEAHFEAICSLMIDIYPPTDVAKRRTSRRDWDRAARQQRVSEVGVTDDPELVADELERLLRRAVSRSPAHVPYLEASLVALSGYAASRASCLKTTHRTSRA